MAAVGFQMKTNDGFDVRRVGVKQAERAAVSWSDSSWELLHGLEVVEDLPLDAWPQDPP
ncbi:MAG: hypothetical protein IV105_13080, partial [Rhizobacter sp.]|nr:hypothetical protein [Rhizobacter sp.]